MQHRIAFLLSAFAASSSLFSQEVNPVVAEADKPLPITFQADAIGFDNPVSVAELKQQTTARIAINKDTEGALKAGYTVLSYTFILISVKNGEQTGVHKIEVSGNSLAPIQTLLGSAKPGDFIMFTDIKMQQPVSEKHNTPARYIENYSATLID
jgi:hypothetical protein